MRRLFAIFLVLACTSIASARTIIVGGAPVTGSASSVARTGSVTYISATTETGSSNVEVPADATACVAAVAGYNGSIANIFTAVNPTLGGTTMGTARHALGTTDGGMTAIWLLASPTVSPGSGTRALAWDWNGTPAEGGNIYFACYSTVNTTTPVGSTGGEQATDNGATTGSLTASSGDMFAGIAYCYDGGTPNVTWTNATEAAGNEANGLRSEYAEASLTGNVTVSISGTQCDNYVTLGGIIIKVQ